MSTFSIQVNSRQPFEAMQQLEAGVRDSQSFLAALGQDITERAKRRFDTSTGPDGAAWRPNAEATLGILESRLGEGFRKKNGALNKKGVTRIAAKKPLIELGDLRRQIVPMVAGDTLTVAATQLYAGIQQFGGKAGRGLKVTIPARPFMPLRPDGSLYPAEEAEIMTALNDYIDSLLP